MNLNKLACEYAKLNTRADGTHDWQSVSNGIARDYGIVSTPNAWRRRWQRSKEAPETQDAVSIELKGDGTTISERLIKMNSTQMKDAKFVMTAHGFNPNEFDLVSARNNLWKTNSKDGELFNYQSKISVKPKEDRSDLSREDILELVSDFKPLVKDFKLKPTSNSQKEKYALEINLSDVHIGSLSWHEEVGEDNDYKVAFETIYRYVEQAKEIIDMYDIEELYICFLGDFLQVDTEGGTTTKGTQVDLDSRPKKMVSKAMEIVMYIIEELAITKTNIYWIEGNHSRLVEYTLFQSLPFIYKNAKHITFDVSPRLRKAFMYGDNLIGLHHGEMSKGEMFNWLQVEFREMWGKARYAEQHSGHIHQEKVIEKGGIIQRTNPTPKVQDLYEYENGWKSEKTSIAYLWTKKNKLKGQFYLR